jgi:hypothetical protein
MLIVWINKNNRIIPLKSSLPYADQKDKMSEVTSQHFSLKYEEKI